VLPNQRIDAMDFDGTAVFRIRVLGRLDERWSERLGGLDLKICDEEPEQTELTGYLADQAALMGVLQHLYTRGISILLVERQVPEDPTSQ